MNTTEAGTGLAAPLVTEWNGNLPAGPRNFVESIGGAVFDPGADTVVLGAPLAGAPGTARGLFFYDADGNGAYTPGEDFSRLRPGLGPALRRGKGRTWRTGRIPFVVQGIACRLVFLRRNLFSTR